MIKITKIQGGYFCEGANFNLLAFNLLDLICQLWEIYDFKLSLFQFNNNN